MLLPFGIGTFLKDTKRLLQLFVIIFHDRKHNKDIPLLNTSRSAVAWVKKCLLNGKKILAVINATYAVAKRKPEKTGFLFATA